MKRRREDLLGTKPSAIAEDDEAGIAHERRNSDGESSGPSHRLLAALIAVVLVLSAAGVGYWFGSSGGESIGDARKAGARAGSSAGRTRGEAVGGSDGEKDGYDQKYRAAYDAAFKKALDDAGVP